MSRCYIGCYSAQDAEAKLVHYRNGDGSVHSVDYFGDREKGFSEYVEYLKLKSDVEFYEKEGNGWYKYGGYEK